ncbi:MAG: Ig-like domain-containing protein [Thermaceae bacterium]|nr:Ig-like domain-containing protein [Thermaceae bacterium]
MRPLLFLVIVLLLAACNQPQKPGQNNPVTVEVTIQVAWPAAAQYQSLVVSATLAGGGQSSTPLTLNRPNPSGKLNAPVGDELFTVKVYDAANGTGNLVAQTLVRQTVGGGQSNVLSLSFASPSIPVDHVDVSLAASSLAPGQTTTATATARDANGNALVGSTFTWASSATAVATVDSSGSVRAVALGSANISATETTSGKAGSATLTVSTTPAPPSPPTPPAPSSIARVEVGPASGTLPQGAKSQLLAKAFDAQNNEVPTTFSWVSSNPSVLGVSSSGQVSAQSQGSSTVIVSAGGKSATATLSVGAASTAQPSASWSALEPTSYPAVDDLVVAADGTQYASVEPPSSLYRRSGGNSWTPVYADYAGAPWAYSIQLTADPTTSNKLWAWSASQQSLYLSTNGGLSWVLAVSGPSLGRVYYHPLNSSVLYAGGYRSGDGGVSWRYVSSSSIFLWSPTDPQTLFDFDPWTSSGRKSTNGGTSWNTLTLPTSGYTDVKVAGDGTLYLLGNAALYASTDQGASWSTRYTGSALGGTSYLLISPANPNRLYAYRSYTVGWAFSTNGGTTWSTATLPFSVGNVSPDPASPGVLYATGFDPATGKYVIYRSANDGATWQDTGVRLSYNFPPFNVRNIGGITYLATVEGLWASADGQNWSRSNQNRGLVSWAYSGADRTSVNRVLALPYSSSDGGQSWAALSSNLPTGTLYQSGLTASRWWLAGVGGDVFLSSDNLATIPWVRRIPYQQFGSVLLAPSPRNDQLVYAGGSGGVYKSTDGGATWNAAFGGLQHATVSAIVVNPANDQMVFVATGHAGVYKSTDGAASWQAANRGLGNLETSSLCLAADNSTLVAGTNDGGVYVSLDLGGTWGWSSSVGSYSVNGVACDPSDPNVIYAATTGGVYKSVDKGSSWTQASVGLTTPYDQKVWVSPDGQTLYLQTQDQGVFKGQPSASGGAGFRTQSVKRWLELRQPIQK